MHFTKGTKSISKFVLMFFALIVFSGALTQSSAAAPTPTPIQVQTFGTLPVMVFNFTQSAITINLVPSLSNVYTSAGFPMGVGLSGVYYVDQGTGMAPVPSLTNPRINGLSPFVTNGNQYNANNDFMQMFTLFPSWSATSANSAAMRDCTMVSGGQPSANTAGVIVKYADYNNYTMNKGSNAGTLYAHDSANPSSTAIKLSLVDPAIGSKFASYDININNLGKGTSAFQAEPANASPDYLQTMLEIAIDAESIITGDPLGIIAIFAGIPATVQNISEAVNNNAFNSVYKFPDKNPVSSKGVTVLAANDPTFTGGGTVTYNKGDSDSSLYNVLSDPNDPQSYANLPLPQQNFVYVRTFRQAPPSNGGATQLSSADLLMVFVVNEAVYSANQTQQLINNPSPALRVAAKAPYKPTKAQAEDSLKILKIITDIHKANPQDAKQLIAMFGTQGTYKNSKKDAVALGKIKIQLIEIFEKHKKDLPAINEYLTKLHQK